MIAILLGVAAFLWHWGWAASAVLGLYSLFHHAPAHARAGDFGGISMNVLLVMFAVAMYYLPALRWKVFKLLVGAYKGLKTVGAAIESEASK